MAKKLNTVETSEKMPTSLNVREFSYDENDWVDVCKMSWDGKLWSTDKDVPWLQEIMDNGKFYNDRKYTKTDKELGAALRDARWSMQAFIPDDEQEIEE